MKLKVLCQSASAQPDGECLYSFHQSTDAPEKWRPFIDVKEKAGKYQVSEQYTMVFEITKAEKV